MGQNGSNLPGSYSPREVRAGTLWASLSSALGEADVVVGRGRGEGAGGGEGVEGFAGSKSSSAA